VRRPAGAEPAGVHQRLCVTAVGLHPLAAGGVHRLAVRVGDDHLEAEIFQAAETVEELAVAVPGRRMEAGRADGRDRAGSRPSWAFVLRAAAKGALRRTVAAAAEAGARYFDGSSLRTSAGMSKRSAGSCRLSATLSTTATRLCPMAVTSLRCDIKMAPSLR